MGFFRKMGRNVEEFAQSVKESADETADYRCVDCDERFHADHDECPECGGDVVVVEQTESDERAKSGGPTESAESAESAESTDATDSVDG